MWFSKRMIQSGNYYIFITVPRVLPHLSRRYCINSDTLTEYTENQNFHFPHIGRKGKWTGYFLQLLGKSEDK